MKRGVGKREVMKRDMKCCKIMTIKIKTTGEMGNGNMIREVTYLCRRTIIR